MTNWTQIFGLTLILNHLFISSNSAATVGRSLFHEDDRTIQEDEPQGRLKTRRMMMGLGAEMDSWGNDKPDYGAVKNPHRGRSVVTLFSRATGSRSNAPVILERGSGVAHGPSSFDDSVIVLRNHKRSEGHGSSSSKSTSLSDSVIVLKHHKRSAGQPSRNGSPGSKSTSLRDSVIVLRNHKRSEGHGSSSSKSTSLPDSVIVLKDQKRSAGRHTGSGSSGSKSTSLRDSVIVLRNHKRSDGQRTSGAGSGSPSSKSTSFRDSTIVLRNHKRQATLDGLSATGKHQPEIVLKNSKRSDDSIFSESSSLKNHKRSEDEQTNVLQKRTPRPSNAPAAPILERSLEGSSKVPMDESSLSDSGIELKKASSQNS